MTPMKAIRAKCLECCAGNWFEVKQCQIEGCSLYLYRFGHRPTHKRGSRLIMPRSPHRNVNKSILKEG